MSFFIFTGIFSHRVHFGENIVALSQEKRKCPFNSPVREAYALKTKITLL